MTDQEIKAYIETSKAIIEIAGPSPDGFAYFTDHTIAAPKWTVTNYKNPITINPFGEHPLTTHVDLVVNARHMPFEDASVDAFLASYLSNSSDFYMDIKFRPLRSLISDVLGILAKRAYRNRNLNTRINLRIQFLKEAYRRLRSGGLVIMVGPFEDDCAVAEKVGFEIIERCYVAKDESETAVFNKP